MRARTAMVSAATALAAALLLLAVPPAGAGGILSPQVLHSFTVSDGQLPQTALTEAPDGRLWGTTIAGGPGGHGTVFATDPATGLTTTMHGFDGTDGSDPLGQLLVGPDGALWGTTRYAGSGCALGCGEVYRITVAGAFSVVHTMTDLEGGTLQGGLVTGPDGRLYGTATTGGLAVCHSSSTGCGSVYAIDPATGQVAVLHAFNLTDGKAPYGRLFLASDGFLYGTTSTGGSPQGGTLFRIRPDGTGFASLVSFAATSAGCQPKAGPVQGKDGRIYGTNEACGSYNSGALWVYDPATATTTALYRFDPDGYAKTGRGATSELLPAQDGNLYGTTRLGGTPTSDPNRAGTIFRVTLGGALTTLWTFTGQPGGNQPSSGLIQARDGELYGVTPTGGAGSWPGNGTVYRLPLPHPASVTVSPSTIAAHGTATGTVTLTQAALPGGAVVTLRSSAPALAKAPPTVRVPPGATSATFTVSAGAPTRSRTVTLTATYQGVSASTTITVTP